jgi:hypothetical protein
MHVDRLGELLQAENHNIQSINSFMLDESLAQMAGLEN